MLENIVRHIEHGMRPYEAALKGAREIGFTIISITFSLIAVFIPVLLMGGIVGRVFRANGFTAATIAVERDQEVISTGPYAIVRHPMYAGALVMLAGVPLALDSWWALLAGPRDDHRDRVAPQR